MKKYEMDITQIKLSEENGVPLYRIKALKDFADVKAGEYGGWIASESNLEQNGDCWIYDDSIVTDCARVGNNAKVKGDSVVRDFAHVWHNCIVDGHAIIRDNALLLDNAVVSDFATICTDAIVCDLSVVGGTAIIGGDMLVSGNAKISDGIFTGQGCLSD